MVESIKLSIKGNIQNTGDTLDFLFALPVILGMFHFYIFSLWFYWDLAPEIPLVLGTAVLFFCYRRLEWYIPLKVESQHRTSSATRVHWLETLIWYAITAGLFWHLSSHFDFRAELSQSYFKVMLWGYTAVLVILLTLGTVTEYLISFISGFIERLQRVPMLVDRVLAVFMVYISVASIFAAIYRYLSLWTDNAFNQPIASTLDAFYFSVVTMTTLGYGDIHPVSNLAKGLVIVEVLSGVMLLAIMVGVAISVSFYEIDHEDW
ncbi:MAG: ion channel [Pseudomonadota bacterium]|nr:ion channel [Pseudomonadota bacterium]